MSRANYCDGYDMDPLDLGRWRARVMSAIRGKRGQKLLREMRDALDAMPNKRLISSQLVTPEGEVCALGCVAVARGMDVSKVDPEEPAQVAAAFDIAQPLAQEIAFENDEAWGHQEPEARWKSMRRWVESHIKE